MLETHMNTIETESPKFGGEYEKLRRQFIGQTKTLDLLRNEVKTMQGQLQTAYIRIAELNTEINELKEGK